MVTLRDSIADELTYRERREKLFKEMINGYEDCEVDNLPFIVRIAYEKWMGRNAQSTGATAERILGGFLGWNRLSSSENRGDFSYTSGNRRPTFVELKTSFANKDYILHPLQIRLYQELDYYVMIFATHDTNEMRVYVLSHDEMEYEVQQIGTASHGTKTVADTHYESIEWSVTVHPLSVTTEPKSKREVVSVRWENKYRNEDLELILLGKKSLPRGESFSLEDSRA